jgi:hypothetical protein
LFGVENDAIIASMVPSFDARRFFLLAQVGAADAGSDTVFDRYGVVSAYAS